jgi:hypothetical protein
MSDGSDKFLKYEDSANFTAFSPDDIDHLVTWVKRQLEHWSPKTGLRGWRFKQEIDQ